MKKTIIIVPEFKNPLVIRESIDYFFRKAEKGDGFLLQSNLEFMSRVRHPQNAKISFIRNFYDLLPKEDGPTPQMNIASYEIEKGVLISDWIKNICPYEKMISSSLSWQQLQYLAETGHLSHEYNMIPLSLPQQSATFYDMQYDRQKNQYLVGEEWGNIQWAMKNPETMFLSKKGKLFLIDQI